MTEKPINSTAFYKIFKSSFAYFDIALSDSVIFKLIDYLSKDKQPEFTALIEKIDASDEQKANALHMINDCVRNGKINGVYND